MTGEPKDKTEPWVEQHRVAYPYAYEPTGELFKKLGLRGYPSAVLIDPKGEIVWSDHPGALHSTTIEKHLRGASTASVFFTAISRKWPESAKPVAKDVERNKLSRALEKARKLAEEDAEGGAVVVADIERRIAQQMDQVKALREKGDFLGFVEQAEDLQKAIDGLPEEQELAGWQEQVKDDKKARDVMNAQKQVAKLRLLADRATAASQLQRIARQLEKLKSEHDGTFAAQQAEKLLGELSARTGAKG